MKPTTLYLILLSVFFLPLGSSLAQEDIRGSKDHPLFTRMPGYVIGAYEEQEFGSDREFRDSKGNWITVEGRHYKISYRAKRGVKPQAAAAVIRNYAQAIQRAGGEVVFQGPQNAYMKIERGGRRTWARVYATGGEWYTLVVVEEGALEQVVEANAEAWRNDIRQTGKVAIYGIYFDTGKSDIKSESEPTIKEIAKLLTEDPALTLHVVGHTDNVGDLDYNLALSKARADAVVQTLVVKHNIAAARLQAHGVGPLSPVASNKTDDGRALNRRVELVER